MSASGTNVPLRMHHTLVAEMDRLREQVMLSWSKEHRLLRRQGLLDGARVLDLGCGPGFVMAELLEDYEELHVTGVDHDGQFLGEARPYLENWDPERFELVDADAAKTGLKGRSFDFCLARFLFQQLPDPAAVAREMYRVMRPGGRAVVVDIDGDVAAAVEPLIPELELMARRMDEAFQTAGGNRRIGRRLIRLLTEAGFEDVALESIVVHSDEVGLQTFRPQLDPERLRPLVHAGQMQSADVEIIRNGLERFFRTPGAMAMSIILLAVGRKPERER